MLYSGTWKKGRSFLKIVCFLLCSLIFITALKSNACASMVEQVFKDGSEIDSLSRICQGRKIWKQVIDTLYQDYPTAGDDIGFWVGNLDQDVDEELIVRIWTYDSPTSSGSEHLLVYDLKEDNMELEPELLFKTSPPVPIRYGFGVSPDGDGMVYTAITSSASGDCVEGTVRLNETETDLEYLPTRYFSLAANESPSENIVEVFGYYDRKNPENTDWGPLDLEIIMDQNFTLGIDNNGFKHTANENDARSGFSGISARQISLDQYASLVAGQTNGTIAEINEYLNRDFEGVCFGLTAAIALVKEGNISLSSLDPDAQSFYDLEKPNENQVVFNQICYLHTMQNLLSEQDYDYIVHCKDNSALASDLQKLIENIRSDRFQILNFTTQNTGHALLITELAYYKDPGIYNIRFYDVNSLDDNTPQGRFFDLFIKDDFSAFAFTDANGECITQDNCQEMSLLSVDTLLEKTDKNEEDKESLIASLSFSSTLDLITFEDAEGNAMKYDCETDQITGDTQKFSVLPCIVNTLSGQTSSTYMRIALNTSDSYKLTCDPNGVDIQINTGTQYFTLQGCGLETASFSNSNGIQLTGTDYNFKISLSTNEEDAPALYQIEGVGQGTISFLETSEGIQVHSELPVYIGSVNILQNMEFTTHEVHMDTSDITLSPYGIASPGSSLSLWISLISIAISVLILALFLILFRHFHKQDRKKAE